MMWVKFLQRENLEFYALILGVFGGLYSIINLFLNLIRRALKPTLKVLDWRMVRDTIPIVKIERGLPRERNGVHISWRLKNEIRFWIIMKNMTKIITTWNIRMKEEPSWTFSNTEEIIPLLSPDGEWPQSRFIERIFPYAVYIISFTITSEGLVVGEYNFTYLFTPPRLQMRAPP